MYSPEIEIMNVSQEQLIKKIGEQAQCYSILHRESQSYYGWLNHFTAIPVIVLSTVAGSGSFIFGGERSASLGIGAISIMVGILQTLASYFRHAQLSETHRVCAISYQKMFMNISAELSLPPEQRQDTVLLMSGLRSEIERLSEISPPIPITIIVQFKQKYKEYTDVSRPSIANGLETIAVYSSPIEIQVPPAPPPTPVLGPQPTTKIKPTFKL